MGLAQEFQKSAEYKKYLAVAKPKAKAAGRKWQELDGNRRNEHNRSGTLPGIPPGIPSTPRKSKGGQEGNQERPSDSGQHAEKATQSYDPLHGSQQRPVVEGGRSKFGFGMFWNCMPF